MGCSQLMKPLTRRATACYRSATPRQLAAGERWYPDAHELAHRQAHDHHVTIEVASGVLAALSPRNGWGPNVMLAERMLASGGTLDRGTLGRSLEQARAIVAGTHPLEVLNGPKTRAFYEAILSAGESSAAVIDRHAWDMLVGQRGSSGLTPRQYREASDRMTRAARICEVSTSHMQAVTWVTWRELWWSPTAFGIESVAP